MDGKAVIESEVAGVSQPLPRAVAVIIDLTPVMDFVGIINVRNDNVDEKRIGDAWHFDVLR